MKKRKIVAGSLALITALSLMTTVSAEQAKKHSKVYNDTVRTLKKIDHIYSNSDGSVGGVFKLVDGQSVRVAGVDEDGEVLVYYTSDKKKTLHIMDKTKVESYVSRLEDSKHE